MNNNLNKKTLKSLIIGSALLLVAGVINFTGVNNASAATPELCSGYMSQQVKYSLGAKETTYEKLQKGLTRENTIDFNKPIYFFTTLQLHHEGDRDDVKDCRGNVVHDSQNDFIEYKFPVDVVVKNGSGAQVGTFAHTVNIVCDMSTGDICEVGSKTGNPDDVPGNAHVKWGNAPLNILSALREGLSNEAARKVDNGRVDVSVVYHGDTNNKATDVTLLEAQGNFTAGADSVPTDTNKGGTNPAAATTTGNGHGGAGSAHNTNGLLPHTGSSVLIMSSSALVIVGGYVAYVVIKRRKRA